MPRLLKSKYGTASRRDLCDLVATLSAPAKKLGLTHLTSSYALRDILDSGYIRAMDVCPFLGQRLTYTFYGRPAFRGSKAFEPTDLASMFPSVLILDPMLAPKPTYVFGFDSGAFVDGKMDQFLHPYMPLNDFSIGADATSAAALVHSIFQTADNYFRNMPQQRPLFSASNFEAECYFKVVFGYGHGPERLDERATTPELLFETPIALRPCVRAAVLPDTLACDPNIGGRLRSAGVDVYEYAWTNCSRPGESHGTINAMVKGIHGDYGWL